MQELSIALVGFGNVGKALVKLFDQKSDYFEKKFDLRIKVSGIATGRHGMAVNPLGIDVQQALTLENISKLSTQPAPETVLEFIQVCPADVLFENSPVNHETGQPAVSYIRAALEKGMHVITANKGPVVHAFAELSELAAANGKKFKFESTVMDGAPIFTLFDWPLPAAELSGFKGILNSCTNLILGRMETGESFEEAVAYAQSIGIAESDPSEDIEGWDASVKVAALVTVLMGIPFKPQMVQRQGIRSVSPAMLEEARQAGERWKLVCEAVHTPQGIQASVQPRRVSPDSALYAINGTSSYVEFETDVLPGLGIVESNPGPDTTAYGLMVDLISILREGDL